MGKWKPILETDKYEASIDGYIRNAKTGRILQGTIDERGRVKVLLRIRGRVCARYVKRLVAEAFWGEIPDDLYIYQKDGDGLNCGLNNLAVGTRSEIIKHTYSNGKRQANNTRAIRCVETGEVYSSIAECSKNVGLSPASISKCLNYPEWCNNRKGYHFELVE